MRQIFTCCVLIFALGCAHRLDTYVDDPKTIFEDPLSVQHQAALDELESRYLRKELNYAEYLERKKLLEEDYAQKVQIRKDKIENYR